MIILYLCGHNNINVNDVLARKTLNQGQCTI